VEPLRRSSAQLGAFEGHAEISGRQPMTVEELVTKKRGVFI
jgi:hypothetical protein